jgi:hypothetical protein
MCSSFDYIDNETKQGLPKMRYFKNANISHFKAKREPVDHLEDILDDKYLAEMLTKCFQVQAFYPTQVSTDANHLMNTLQMHNKWILNNKKLSAEKTMSKLLSIALKDILKYSQKHQQDNMSPWPTHHFVHQKDMTVASYQKVFESEKSDESYKYCTIKTRDPCWGECIKDLFNKDKTKAYTNIVQYKQVTLGENRSKTPSTRTKQRLTWATLC